MLYCIYVSHGRGRGGTSIAALGLFRNDFITLPASSLSFFFITRNCSIEVTSFLCTHASPRHLIRGIIYYLVESRYSSGLTRMHPQRHPDNISIAIYHWFLLQAYRDGMLFQTCKNHHQSFRMLRGFQFYFVYESCCKGFIPSVLAPFPKELCMCI